MMVCKHMVVMLFAGLVVQCTAMSLSELEDFANFLKKTSQLDETLKKGTDTVDYDEDEAVSDNAWEESGKFEGDLILNERQRRMIVEDIAEGLSRNGLRDSTKRWPDNEVIYYIQKEHFSSDQVQAIRDGIDDLARASCVKFRPYRKGDRDAVVIQGSRRGCFSQVGYQGGYQVLNLSGRHPVGRGCFRHGTVVHELLHSLGFYHMQSSPDRDDYVDIKWENIVQPARHNFRKYNAFSVSDFGVGYDYDSVLHYSRRAFSSNGQDTIVPKQGGANIGQRTGLSDKDAQKLNKMYCDADNSNDENDSPTHKTPVKKKTPKNKPFEGHGIGYHQGKTVVIKLSPAAETYHIVNKPAFPMFNYFSKASQVLSPKETEGFGPGTRVANKPYTYNEDVIAFKPLVSNINSKPTNNEKSLPNNDVDSKVIKHENTNKSPENKDEDLDDAFKRLAKILKTHVYPKHLPDLKVFKVNTDYSEFGDPQKLPKIAYSFVPTLTIQRDDKLYPNEHIKSLNGNGPESLKSEKLDPSKLQKYIDNYSKLFQETHVNEDHTEDSTHREESESEKHKLMVEKLRNPKNMFEIVETVKEHGVPLDADAKYRTTYPFILKHENSSGSFSIELQTPDYALHDNLKDKHNFSNLYRPYLRDEDDSGNIKYTLFGESVPTYDDWYQRDDHRRNPIDYSRQSYTDSGPYSNNLIHRYDTTDSSEQEPDDTKYTTSFSPQTKQAYTLYGAPVPLTEDWYKVNRKQIIGDYPHTFYRNNEYSESSEDDSKEK